MLVGVRKTKLWRWFSYGGGQGAASIWLICRVFIIGIPYYLGVKVVNSIGGSILKNIPRRTAWVLVACVFAIVIIECVALSQNINGLALSTSFTAIGGIVGYLVSSLKGSTSKQSER